MKKFALLAAIVAMASFSASAKTITLVDELTVTKAPMNNVICQKANDKSGYKFVYRMPYSSIKDANNAVISLKDKGYICVSGYK